MAVIGLQCINPHFSRFWLKWKWWIKLYLETTELSDPMIKEMAQQKNCCFYQRGHPNPARQATMAIFCFCPLKGRDIYITHQHFIPAQSLSNAELVWTASMSTQSGSLSFNRKLPKKYVRQPPTCVYTVPVLVYLVPTTTFPSLPPSQRTRI